MCVWVVVVVVKRVMCVQMGVGGGGTEKHKANVNSRNARCCVQSAVRPKAVRATTIKMFTHTAYIAC